MFEKLPLSVHVLTHNSANTLARALESVRFAKEIIVADGGSTDETIAIAKKFGATVIHQPPTALKNGIITDFSMVRNALLEKTTQPWILVLDSDEYLSSALQNEIKTVVSNEKPAVYLVPRKYVFNDGKVIELASTYPNRRFYFFHRDAIEGWIKPVHERVIVKSDFPIYRFEGAMLAPLPTIEEFKRKNLQYIRIEAEASKDKGWGHWFQHRLLHTLRSRLIGTIRLASIWLLPRKGPRLPFKHEMLRYWYGYQLIIQTRPK